jgi:hypothetical protein
LRQKQDKYWVALDIHEPSMDKHEPNVDVDEWNGGAKVVMLPDMTAMKDMHGLEQIAVLQQQGIGAMLVGTCKL